MNTSPTPPSRPLRPHRSGPGRTSRTQEAARTDARASQGVPLWQQLQEAARVLQGVQTGSSVSVRLEAVPEPLRPGVQALTYAVLRHLGEARWLRDQLVPRRPPPAVDALLLVALALAARMDGGMAGEVGAQYTAFTLVNQVVEAAKRQPRARAQAALINAVLRRFLREREHWMEALCQASPRQQPALLNVPEWWWQRLEREHGAEVAERIVRESATAAPMTLRIHPRAGTPREYLEHHLRPAGLDGVCNGAHGVTLQQAVHVSRLPGFQEGWVSVQDAGAQLAAPLLVQALQQSLPALSRPWTVLDACAAPGGKTAHLLELGVEQVTALDVDPARCTRIHDTLQRLGVQARVQAADAADLAGWWKGETYDAILLDAPCTASGIVARHPDVVWLRRPEDIDALARQQRRLLEALWPLVKPGGVLLYCTCSVFTEEGAAQQEAFLSHHSEATALPAPGHLLPLHLSSSLDEGDNSPHDVHGGVSLKPPLRDHDGFFYALFRKTP